MSAWDGERRRDDLQRQRLLKKANVTRKRLRSSERCGDEGPVQAMYAAIAILPELADPSVAGRQQVIASVSKQIPELAKGGDVAQIRPTQNDDRRKTRRYALASASGGDDNA